MHQPITELGGKISRRVLSQEVADRIQQLIEDQSLGLGTGLPSESNLAEEFGVSRTVIREALKILRTKGLITIWAGKGSVVTRPSRVYVVDAIRLFVKANPDTGSFDNLYEVRKVLECGTAELAALRRTEEDLEALRKAAQQMELKCHDAIEYTRADLAFHKGLARATHNELFLLLLEPITELLLRAILLGRGSGGIDSGIKAHKAILRCVEERDAVGAKQLMLNHVKDSRHYARGELGHRQAGSKEHIEDQERAE